MHRSATGDDWVGLVRMLDRTRPGHLYAAGAAGSGELVGELGCLHAHAGSGLEPVRLTAGGRLITDAYEPEVPRLRPLALVRWLVAPLAWRGFATASVRLNVSLSRARMLARLRRIRSAQGTPAAVEAGWLDREPGPRSIALFSAVHPVTGDQLLTADRWEAVDLGYVDVEQLGFLVAEAPVTGSLSASRPELPWASRLGQAVRSAGTHEPLAEEPRGEIQGPSGGAAEPPFKVTGWALSPATSVARVEVLVDGRPAGAARLGLDRADVAAQFGHADAPVCGFDHVIRAEHVPPGTQEVTVAAVATDLEGRRFGAGEVAVAIEVTPTEGDSRGPELRGRARSLCREVRSAPAADTNVLVVAHSLALGGAGLWLGEVIERLAARPGTRFTVVSAADGPLRDPLEALGIPVHITGDHPLHGVAEYEGRLAELAAWAAPQGFNVAVVNTLRAFPGVEVADLLGIPSVFAIHESYHLDVWWLVGYAPGAVHPYVKRRAEEAIAGVTAAVFEADATRRMHAPEGGDGRFIALPYGIELDRIDRHRAELDRARVRERQALAPSAQVVLCLGLVEPRKGQACLAQAFRAVADDHPDAVLALVGQSSAPRLGPYNDALAEHLARAGLAGRVSVAPMAPLPYEWLGAADLLVCASEVESLPRVILEGMAFEVPVLATRIFGVPEVIDDGRNGWLAEPSDVGALAAALDRALAVDAETRAGITAEARRTVRTGHDAEVYAGRFAALLEGLAADPDADPRLLLGARDDRPEAQALRSGP